jgi:DnaK suppressor protein
MEEDQLLYFKEVLTRQLNELQSAGDRTVIDLMAHDYRAIDPVDIAQIDSDRDYMLRIRSRESRLITKIKDSLEDIENGTYGICAMCGEDISIARLHARPVARHCIECKRKMEATERVAGW